MADYCPVTVDDGMLNDCLRGCRNFCQLITRHEYKIENFLAFIYLGCIVILMRQYF